MDMNANPTVILELLGNTCWIILKWQVVLSIGQFGSPEELKRKSVVKTIFIISGRFINLSGKGINLHSVNTFNLDKSPAI
jgi:hypothetical protein